jgi:hypothetical protein
MAPLTHIELTNWAALYLAAALCCGLACLLSAAAIVVEIHRERGWLAITSTWAAIRWLPKVWWRWQKLYLTSAPATLAIVGAFAVSMRWS